MSWAMKDDGLESELQNQAMEYAASRGWCCEKIMRTRRNGFPDYFFARRGIVIFVEFKKFGERPGFQQLKRHRELRDHGVRVEVIDQIEQAYAIFG